VSIVAVWSGSQLYPDQQTDKNYDSAGPVMSLSGPYMFHKIWDVGKLPSMSICEIMVHRPDPAQES
jgi:hypothetical protein